MEKIYKKNFLISARYRANNNQYDRLIISQDQIYCSQPRSLYEILVSQYSTIMTQDTISIFQDHNQKYPLPIAYACLKFAFDSQNHRESLRILHRNLQKQYEINNYIISFNIAMIYKKLGDMRKCLFYLELLLKQNPIFEDGIYQYCLILLKNDRNQQVVRMLSRHLQNQLSNSQTLQCLYLQVVSRQSQTHQKQLLKLFHNKKISPIVAFNLGLFLMRTRQPLRAIQVFKGLHNLLIEFHKQDVTLKYKKLLTMVRINLLQLLESKIEYINDSSMIKSHILKDVQIENQFSDKIMVSLEQKPFQQRHNQQKNEKQNIKTQRLEDQFTASRKVNKKRLLYLLKKQHQINNFFKRVKFQKNNQTVQFRILNQTIITNARKDLQMGNFEEFQKEFQEKKQKHRLNYNHQDVKNVISDYFDKVFKGKGGGRATVSKKKQAVISKGKFRIKKGNYTAQKFTQTESIDKTITKIQNDENLNSKIDFNKLLIPSSVSISKTINIAIVQLTQFQKALGTGAQLQAKKQWQQAHNHYLKMYKQFKKIQQKQQILLKLAAVFENTQNIVDAQKTYLKCCKFNNAKAFLNLGSLLLKQGQINQGVQSLEKANCIERFNIQIETKLVYGYSLSPSTIQKAFSLATNILKRNPQSFETLIMITNILQKQGKIKQALQIAQAIDRFKQSFEIKHYIGLLYLNDSNIQMAYQYFQSAVKLKPDHVLSLIQIATILSDVKPTQSIKILKKVLEYDETNRLALARLGKIYEQIQCDYENAMATYKKSLQVQKNYESYIKIGDVLKKKQSIVQAYLNYKQALSLKQTCQAHQKMAEIYQIQKQYKKAYESYQSALALADNTFQYCEQKKRILESSGRTALLNRDYESAISALNEALNIEESPNIYVKLGDAYYGKGQYNQSLANYQTAFKLLGNNDIEIMQKIALCFDRKEQYLASKQIYQKILVQNPSNIRCLTNLANILLIIGNTNEAFYWLENMLMKIPNNIQKRLRVADIYATVGDWSKVENHLLFCYKQKQNDIRVIEKLINLYKQKRQLKLAQKFQKKYALLKTIKR